jgi:hypothetical protein
MSNVIVSTVGSHEIGIDHFLPIVRQLTIDVTTARIPCDASRDVAERRVTARAANCIDFQPNNRSFLVPSINQKGCINCKGYLDRPTSLLV